MKRTIVIRRDFLHYVKMYNRFEKCHRDVSIDALPVGLPFARGRCRYRWTLQLEFHLQHIDAHAPSTWPSLRLRSREDDPMS